MSGLKALIDETLMMVQPGRPIICLPNTWLGSTVPSKLRSKTNLNPSTSRIEKAALAAFCRSPGI